MFNKFLDLAGRAYDPFNYKIMSIQPQHMWADAVFIKQIQTIPHLETDKILKLSLLSAIYGSPDLVHYCLHNFDKRNSSTMASQWLQKIGAGRH